MTIDVSKLKKGDRYRTKEEGWLAVDHVEDSPTLTGCFRVFDSNMEWIDYSRSGVSAGHSVFNILEVDTATPTSAPIKSDGGSSSYYTFPQELFDKIVERGHVETEDIIKYGFGNDFDFGNILKSLKRLYELQRGGGKEGNTEQYEVNKIIYSLNKINGNKVTK
jgi:hypothetical protein